MPEHNIANSRNREELYIDFIQLNLQKSKSMFKKYVLNLTELLKNVSENLFIYILFQILKENISVIDISFPRSNPVLFSLRPRNVNRLSRI